MSTILISCNNKGCFASDYHKLDAETNEVVCANCGGNISNISSYMKKNLASAGQVFKRARTSGELKCRSCDFTAAPILIEHAGGLLEVACVKCRVPDTHLTKYFLEALKLRPDIQRFKAGDPVEATDVRTATVVKEDPVSKALRGSALSPKTAERPKEKGFVKYGADEATVSEKPKAEKKGPNKRPTKAKTASELLAQAGFKNLAEELEQDPVESVSRPSFKNKTRAKPKAVKELPQANEII